MLEVGLTRCGWVDRNHKVNFLDRESECIFTLFKKGDHFLEESVRPGVSIPTTVPEIHFVQVTRLPDLHVHTKLQDSGTRCYKITPWRKNFTLPLLLR